MYHNLGSQFSIEKYLSCFCVVFFFLTITNDVLVNILVYMSLCTCASISIWQIFISILFSRSFQVLCSLPSVKNRARRR